MINGVGMDYWVFSLPKVRCLAERSGDVGMYAKARLFQG
jgi:hypothetical protein